MTETTPNELHDEQEELSGSIEQENVDRLHTRRDFLRTAIAFGAAALASGSEIFAQPRKSSELSWNASTGEVAAFLSKHRESVDYGKLWDPKTPVLFIGERHTVQSDKDEVIKNLPLLRKLGMTHLAMEMLREEHQQIIDAYCTGKAPRKTVFEIFKTGWDKRPGMAEKYMELVDAAKANGMSILAVDLYTTSSEYSTGDFFKKRNANWTRIAESILHHTNKAKILFYCGQGHPGYGQMHDHVNEMLGAIGIKSTVIALAGGEVPPRSVDFYVEKVEKAAEDLHIGKERFGFKVKPDSLTRGADYVIHLPQIEKNDY